MEVFYQDPERPASFGGVDALYRASHKKVSKEDIRKWLKGVDAYTLHKPIRKKFSTNRVMVYSMDQQWQADIADLSNLKSYNSQFRYILCVIDIFSKYAWAIPLKQKRGEDIVKAFEKIFLERIPSSLQTDKGGEFMNVKFQKLLKWHNIKFFTTHNEAKASIVERFNRTLKTKMWKYFTSQNTYRYVDVLHHLMKSYNNTFHSSIKMTPAEVNKENEEQVWFTLYGDHTYKIPKCAFQVGDIVRISKFKRTFEKGYESNWSEELFKIVDCVKRNPPVYRIKDLMEEPVLGTFYKQELQKVALKDHYPIDKIIKKRYRKKRLEYFVKYRGYPDKFNQWISADNLTNI